MSVNTSIKEGGKSRTFGPVVALMVQGGDGKYYPWFPESDRALENTLSVTKNGVYQAKKMGVYGWRSVSVNVPTNDSVTGTGSDGNEHVITTEDGEIVDTLVPSSIRVTTLPTRTIYSDGEAIDYSGIIVHAYSANGQDMGAVPFSELVFPVTTASGGEEWTDGAGLNATEVVYTQQWDIDWRGQEYAVYVSRVLGYDAEKDAPAMLIGDGIARLLVTRYNGINYATRLAGDSKFNYACYFPDREQYKYDLGGGTSYRTTLNRFTDAAWHDIITDIPESTVDPTTVDPTALHTIQSLPVQWPRTGDKKALETSFNIQVLTAGGD